MGWDETCALSNMAIVPGVPVRYLLLQQDKGSVVCEVVDIPLKAVYDDYGLVDFLPEQEYVIEYVVDNILFNRPLINPPANLNMDSLQRHLVDFDTIKSPPYALSAKKTTIFSVLVREDVWKLFTRLGPVRIDTVKMCVDLNDLKKSLDQEIKTNCLDLKIEKILGSSSSQINQRMVFFIRKYLNDKLSSKKLFSLLEVYVELQKVLSAMALLRKQWTPSWVFKGFQTYDFQVYVDFFTSLAELAEQDVGDR